MQAARPVATFATGARSKFQVVLVKTAMRARREKPRLIRVTIRASRIPYKCRAGNVRRRHIRPSIDRGAGADQKRYEKRNENAGSGNVFGGNPHRQFPCAKASQERGDVAEGPRHFQAEKNHKNIFAFSGARVHFFAPLVGGA